MEDYLIIRWLFQYKNIFPAMEDPIKKIRWLWEYIDFYNTNSYTG